MIDWANFLMQTAVAGAFSAGMSVVVYKLFQRRDERIDRLCGRVQQLEDEKIKGIQDRLQSGSEEFDELHEGMKGFISRPDHYMHMERCDTKFAAFDKALQNQAREIQALAIDVGGIKSIVSLIATHMHIKIQ